MNDIETQLAQMLRSGAPEPPSEISLGTLRAAQDGRLRASAAAPVRRSPVRRWMPLIAAGAVAASVAGVLGGIALANDHHSSPAATVGPSPSVSPSFAVAAGECTAAQLSGSVIGHDQGSSHDLVVIGVRNTGSASCLLKGYASVEAAGASGAINTVATDGTYLLTDAGYHELQLAPGALASMGVEGQLAYDGPTQTITSLKIIPADNLSGFTVALSPGLSANGPTGKPIPLGITAFALGSGQPTSTPSSPVTDTPVTSPPPLSTPTSGGSTSSQILPCYGGNLTGSASAPNHGAGQTYVTISVKNTSSTTCTLTGYPYTFLAYSSSSGSDGQLTAQINKTVSGDSGNGTKAVTLAPGQSAHLTVHTAVGGYTGPQVTIKRYYLIMPGGSGAGGVWLTLPEAVTASGPTGQPTPIDITPFSAGAGS